MVLFCAWIWNLGPGLGLGLELGLGSDFQNPKISEKIFVSNCAPVFGILPRGEWGRGITDTGGGEYRGCIPSNSNPDVEINIYTPQTFAYLEKLVYLCCQKLIWVEYETH